MDIAAQVVIASLIILGAWRLLQPRTRFVIYVKRGSARVKSGRVVHSFVKQVEDILRNESIENAWIAGIERKGVVTLKCSTSVPLAKRQQLLNAWFALR